MKQTVQLENLSVKIRPTRHPAFLSMEGGQMTVDLDKQTAEIYREPPDCRGLSGGFEQTIYIQAEHEKRTKTPTTFLSRR